MKKIATLPSALVFAALAGSAQAQTPPGLNDLVGAHAAGAETQMKTRGYSHIRSEQGDDRSYSYWWNGSSRQCVTVATMEGRYSSITSSPAPDCNQRDNRRPDDRADNGYRDDNRSGYRNDDGYRPPVTYGAGASNQRQSPSYVEQRDRYQVDGQDIDIGLICFGDGQRPGFATSYGWQWNSRTHRYDYGNRTEMTGQQFDASLTIQLWAGGGRIRLPKKLVPPINSRGYDGWWDLYEVQSGPDIISAKYRLNGLNKPLITINRRSGQISIQGTSPYAFRGTCDTVDGGDHRRF
ncbi:hypothetical protein [Sphingobium sp.]|uniref:hypothetical protein n=1 Tax=Sphingobium sp. TaxID=1912891 RepID=UPI003BB6C5F1